MEEIEGLINKIMKELEGLQGNPVSMADGMQQLLDAWYKNTRRSEE